LVLPLLVCQPGTGLCVLLAVVVSLVLPLLVCQLSTGLYVLLAVVVLLLLGYGGHVSVVVALHLSSTLRLLEGLQIIMVLKRNTRQITFLHVSHHSSIALVVKVCQIATFLPLCQTPHTNWLPLRDQNLLECKRLVLEILYECFGQ
jgi:hypothetical protein